MANWPYDEEDGDQPMARDFTPREDEFNAFILLELDPDAPWNDAAYRISLDAHEAQWAREASRGTGNARQQAHLKLKEVARIKKALGHEEYRRQEAEAANKVLLQRGAGRKIAFADELATAQQSSSISDALLRDWLNRYRDVYTEQEIRALISVPIQEPDPQVDPLTMRPSMLDPEVARRVAARLGSIHEATLYGLLRRTPQTDIAELVVAADALANEMHMRVVKDDTVKAKTDLAGDARAIFSSAETKSQYDATLRYQPFKDLFDRYYVICAPTHSMNAELVAGFLQEAIKLGWSADDAQIDLSAFAIQKSLTIMWPDSDVIRAIKHLLRCMYCETLNDPEANNCKTCGEPLFIDCPQCKMRVEGSSPACDNCGFPVGRRFHAEWSLNEAERLAHDGDWMGVNAYLAEAREDWPLPPDIGDALSQRIAAMSAPYVAWLLDEVERRLTADDVKGAASGLAEAQAIGAPQADATDPTTVRMQTLADKLTKQQEVARQTQDELQRRLGARRQELNEAKSERRFYAALRILAQILDDRAMGAQLRDSEHAELANDRQKIAGAIQRAEQKLQDSSIKDMVQRCVAALAICADFNEAQIMLNNLPIMAPADLEAVPTSDGKVQLTWRASPTPGVEYYRIVRALNHIPFEVVARERIGRPIKSHSDASAVSYSYTDEGPEIGVSQFYGVYAERQNQTSQVRTCDTPIFVAGSASNVEGTIDDRRIELRWTLPQPATGARVTRREQGGGAVPTADTLINSPNAAYVDTKVVNGVSYVYTIHARYKDYQGHEVEAPGVTITRTPAQLPAAPQLGIITAEKSGWGFQAVSIQLPTTQAGLALIYKNSQPPARTPRQITFEDAHLLFGQQMRTSPSDQSCVEAVLFNPGEFWFIPIIHINEVAIVGQTQRYVALYEAPGLRAEVKGNDIEIGWDWSEHNVAERLTCDQAEVLFSNNRWSEDGAAIPHPVIVQRIANRPGRAQHPLPHRELYVMVRLRATYRDQLLVSQGVRRVVRVVRVARVRGCLESKSLR